MTATYAFQYGTEPHPVHVCRFTPASPKPGSSFIRQNPQHKETPLVIISTEGKERDRELHRVIAAAESAAEQGLRVAAGHGLPVLEDAAQAHGAENEGRRQSFDSINLYTHERMVENQLLYAKIGYVEYDRRGENGYSRIYMRKILT